MGTRRLVEVGLIAAVSTALAIAPGVTAGLAHADLNGGGTGCSASATFKASGPTGGLVVDPATTHTTVVVAGADDVTWQASVDRAPGAYSGSLRLDLPAPFGSITIDDWKGTTQRTSTSGSKHYSLPAWAPRGFTIRVLGTQTDRWGTCTGWVDVKIAGKPLDSSAPLYGAVVGLLFAVLLARLTKPLFVRV
jgi:hypothetical protein